MTKFIYTAVLLVFLFSSSGISQIQDPILALPEDEVILHISATERVDVATDLLTATLSYSATNKDAAELQEEINSVMKEALSLTKGYTSIKVQTGSYSVYEQRDPRTKEKKWFGSQTLILKSKNSEAILKLTGKLQSKKLTTTSLSYSVSPKLRNEIKDDLLEAALKQLQQRAKRGAQALGRAKAVLREVKVEGASPVQPARYNRGFVDDAMMASAPPVAAPGESTISLSVSARAVLKP